MRPGEVLFPPGEIELNEGRRAVELIVENTSRHTIFVSSHYPFFEVNRRLVFDRARAWGMHLDIPAGDAVRFWPAETTRVHLVAYGGARVIRGFNGLTEGAALPERLGEALERATRRGFGHRPGGPDSHAV